METKRPTTTEMLEDWDRWSMEEWAAVDQMKLDGSFMRLYVGDPETAERKASDMAAGAGLVDPAGHPCQPGEYGLPENVPFYRWLLIDAEEAREYFTAQQAASGDAWITKKRAAEMLGVTLGRVSQLASSGQLDTLGRLVSREDVERRVESKPKAGRPW